MYSVTGVEHFPFSMPLVERVIREINLCVEAVPYGQEDKYVIWCSKLLWNCVICHTYFRATANNKGTIRGIAIEFKDCMDSIELVEVI